MSIWRLWDKFHEPRAGGMPAIYIHGMLRSIVLAMVGIFTPIYLYKLGMNVWGEARYAICQVVIYFLVTRIVVLILAIPISKIIERIGFRRAITWSLIFLVISLGALILAKDNLIYLLVAAVSAGVNVTLYWIARNSAISQDSSAGSIGKQMGNLLTLEHIATLIGPIAAGLMIEKWGFSYVYLTAIALLIISVLPLNHMPHHVHRNGATYKGLKMWLNNRRYTHLAIGIGGKAVDDFAMAIVWPLVIFTMGINTGVIGGIFSAVAITSLGIRYLVGNIFDVWHKQNDWSDEVVYGFSAIITSFIWLLRVFVSGVGAILLVDLGGGIFGTMYSSLYVDYVHLGGMRMGSIAYWVYQEMIYSMMAIIFMGVVAVTMWIGIGREAAFVFTSMWVLFTIVMARESNLK